MSGDLPSRIEALEARTAPFAPARLRWHRDGRLPTDERLARECLALDADLAAMDLLNGFNDPGTHARVALVERARAGDPAARQELAEHHQTNQEHQW